MSRERNRIAAILGLVMALSCGSVAQTRAETAVIPASADNTLYQNDQGSVSNGTGQHLFVGNNSQGNTRRAVLRFQIDGMVPDGAVVESVSLMMYVSQANAGPMSVNLRALTNAWGEGSSDAPGPEGSGAMAADQDATWLHRFFPTMTWNSPGGDFSPNISAQAVVEAPGYYLWTGSKSSMPTSIMLADVQQWVDRPDLNFGWLLMGEEDGFSNAKRFNSRNHPDDQLHPMLTIEYAVPQQVPAVSTWGLVILALTLLTLAKLRTVTPDRQAATE